MQLLELNHSTVVMEAYQAEPQTQQPERNRSIKEEDTEEVTFANKY